MGGHRKKREQIGKTEKLSLFRGAGLLLQKGSCAMRGEFAF